MEQVRGERLISWQLYASNCITTSPELPTGFLLTRLELEIPFYEFGFDNFEQFLSSLDTKALFQDENVLRLPRVVAEIADRDDIRRGDEVYWVPNPKNLIPFRGKVRWIGNVGGITCAGIDCEQLTGLGPMKFRGSFLFRASTAHAKIVPIRDVLLTKNYEDKSFKTLLSSAFNSVAHSLGFGDNPQNPEPSTPVLHKRNDRVQAASVANAANTSDFDGNRMESGVQSYPLEIRELPNGLKTSDLVVWVTDHGAIEGVLCWIGYLRRGFGLAAGVDFQKEIGDTDGRFHDRQLFYCQPNYGKFVRVEELVSLEDFYRTPAEVAPLNGTSEQNTAVKMEKSFAQEFVIGDFVEYMLNPGEKWIGTVLWKAADKSTDGDTLYGIEFTKPTGLTPAGEQALPFWCRAGYGGLALGSRLKEFHGDVTMEPEQSASSNKTSHNATQQIVTVRKEPEEVLAKIENPGSSRSAFDIDTFIEPHGDLNTWTKSLGFNKGIQGEDNSCYVDATLFVLLAYTDVFDDVLLKDDQYLEPFTRKFKQVLRLDIANQLRRNSYCPSTKVKLLRDEIDRMRNGIRYGKMADVEEFLFVLFERALKLTNFIHYSNGVSDFLHQIIINPADNRQIVTTQRLLENSMFKEGNIKFNRIPSPAFFMIMPRSNGQLVKYSVIVPSLTIDLTHLLADTARPCILCSTNLATTDCLECFDQIANAGVKSSAFCAKCYELFHQEEARCGHYKTIKNILYSVNSVASAKNIALELFGIICFKGSHYVSYAKCGRGSSAQWVRHDSLAAFGYPETHVVPGLHECLTELEKDPSKIQEDWPLFMPDVQQILTDGHMCVYSPAVIESHTADA